jgi:hypothetical protein
MVGSCLSQNVIGKKSKIALTWAPEGKRSAQKVTAERDVAENYK